MALSQKEMKTLEKLLAKSKESAEQKLSKKEITRIEHVLHFEKKCVLVRGDSGLLRVFGVKEWLQQMEQGRKIGNQHAARLKAGIDLSRQKKDTEGGDDNAS